MYVQLKGIFYWFLICHCCSGLQGVEDHFFIYAFIIWLQTGKPTTDWSALGETLLLPGSVSHGESRNVQGDFLPFVHALIWQGCWGGRVVRKQGLDEKMRLKIEPGTCLAFLCISTREWRMVVGMAGISVSVFSAESGAWWVGHCLKVKEDGLYLLLTSGTQLSSEILKLLTGNSAVKSRIVVHGDLYTRLDCCWGGKNFSLSFKIPLAGLKIKLIWNRFTEGNRI